MKRKTKNTLKTIALAVVGVGAIVGAASLLGSIGESADEDLKTIHPTFEVGGLDETTGKYVDDDGTIYTKEAFECQGLEIKLEFDETISYEVFFYDYNSAFIGSSGLLEDNSSNLEVPTYATHARIEITPSWNEMGEDYKDEENQVIKWYNVNKYSSQMEIKVNKEQEVVINYGTTTIGNYSESVQIVDSFEDVEFSYGRVNVGAYDGVSNTANATTVDYCLIVDGGETVAFTQKIDGLLFYIEEHTSLPLDSTTINDLATNNGAWSSSSFTLQDDTKYILVICKLEDGSNFTTAQLELLNSCFEIK